MMETGEWDMIFKLMDTAVSMGLLIYAVMWFKKRDEKKDTEIADLNKEYRVSMESNLNKIHGAFVDSTTTLKLLTDTVPIAIREAVRDAVKEAMPNAKS